VTCSIVKADCLDFLRAQPSDSVDLVFTSPPYEQARLYLEDGQNLGIARDTEDWVTWLVEVWREAQRVCKGLMAMVVAGQTRGYKWSAGPVLLAADLHRAGFNLRNPPIFHRIGIPGNGGPDWLRADTEFIICTTRPGKLPWSDNTACGHKPKWAPGGEMSYRSADGVRANLGMRTSARLKNGTYRKMHYHPPDFSNPGNLIHCNTGGTHMGGDEYCSQNEAPFPESLAEFFVLSFCPPGGMVCDPFSGSGTTATVAYRHGRNFMGCDLRQSQVDLANLRVSEETPLALFNAQGGSQ
jgi:DNA modification methylase